MDTLLESDRIPDAPHPRETEAIFGQDDAVRAFLRAWETGRLHHAWLLTGIPGIGKATLAWQIAGFLLHGGTTAAPARIGDGWRLAPPPESALSRRLLALSEPRLLLLRRGANERGNALSRFITVDDTRQLHDFLGLSAVDGGFRVVIVDAVDDMNEPAANALLKLLEEPPPATVFLLVSHRPGGLLPTIRSRCRVLRLHPLDATALGQALAAAGGRVAADEEHALAELAGGSVGDALRLVALDGIARYQRLVSLLSDLPTLDRSRVATLVEDCTGRGAEEHLTLTLHQIALFLARLAHGAALQAPPPEAARGEAALFARLAPSPADAPFWATLAGDLVPRALQAQRLNLDPGALLMDTLFSIEARLATRAPSDE